MQNDRIVFLIQKIGISITCSDVGEVNLLDNVPQAFSQKSGSYCELR